MLSKLPTPLETNKVQRPFACDNMQHVRSTEEGALGYFLSKSGIL